MRLIESETDNAEDSHVVDYEEKSADIRVKLSEKL